MKISIIASCFNRKATIGQAIESVRLEDRLNMKVFPFSPQNGKNSLSDKLKH